MSKNFLKILPSPLQNKKILNELEQKWVAQRETIAIYRLILLIKADTAIKVVHKAIAHASKDNLEFYLFGQDAIGFVKKTDEYWLLEGLAITPVLLDKHTGLGSRMLNQIEIRAKKQKVRVIYTLPASRLVTGYYKKVGYAPSDKIIGKSKYWAKHL